MDNGFRALAQIVRGDRDAAPPNLAARSVPAESVSSAPRGSERAAFAPASAVAELTLMRLAALEAFESSVPRLLKTLAESVLARELELAPADIEALVGKALAHFEDHQPVAIALSPADVQRVRTSLPVRPEPALRAGDLIVDVRDGSFESHFTFRVQEAVQRAAAQVSA